MLLSPLRLILILQARMCAFYSIPDVKGRWGLAFVRTLDSAF